jgi:L-arabinose transport system substrate-binding protein
MKRLIALAVTTLSLLMAGAAQAAGPVKIGFLVKSPENGWFQNEWKFAEQASKDLGFQLIKIGTPDGEKVVSAIDNLAAQGAQGLVICTPDVKLGPAIVAQAKRLNLKVIAVDDRFVDAGGQPLTQVPYLGISAGKIGEKVGETLMAELKKRGWNPAQTAALVLTNYELQTAKERTDGAKKALLAAGFPEANIKEASQGKLTDDVQNSLTMADPIITRNSQFKSWLVYSLNEESVVGAVRALENRGVKPADIIGVGINGGTVAVNEFKKPTATGFYGTILLAAKDHGYQTAKMMYEWIASEKAPPPDTRTTGTLLTRDNYVKVLTDSGLADELK